MERKEKDQQEQETNNRGSRQGGTNQFDLEIAKSKGTNQFDLEIFKAHLGAVAKNEHDVDIERIRAEHDKLVLQFEDQYKRAELEMRMRTSRFETVVSAIQWCVTGGLILTGYIIGHQINADLEMRKAERQ